MTTDADRTGDAAKVMLFGLVGAALSWSATDMVLGGCEAVGIRPIGSPAEPPEPSPDGGPYAAKQEWANEFIQITGGVDLIVRCRDVADCERLLVTKGAAALADTDEP